MNLSKEEAQFLHKKPMCANCYKEDLSQNFRYCSQCTEVRYCGRECQRDHWRSGHRLQCRPRFGNCPPCNGASSCGKAEATSCDKPCSGASSQASPTNQSSNEDSCPICMETLPPCPVARQILPCGHAFHRCCVTGLRNHGVCQACPLCRAELPPGPEKMWEDSTRRYFQISKKILHDNLHLETLPHDMVNDLKVIFSNWKQAADAGHMMAQVCIGNKYVEGMGKALEANEALAEHYLELASYQGNPQAQYNLGTILFQRYESECLRRGARCSMGCVSEDGVGLDGEFGVNQDLLTLKERAFRLWSLSAEHDEPRALFNLGLMMSHGCLNNGIPDRDKAMFLMRKASDLGHSRAQECLASMRREAENEKQ